MRTSHTHRWRDAELDAGYSVLVVLGGDGALQSRSGRLNLARGATALLPHAAGLLDA